MVGNGGVARRLVAAIASAALVAGLVPAPALAEAAEEFQAAQDVGALEVAECSGDGAPDVADGGSEDGALEAVGDVVTLGAASEEPVVASVQATITGTIGSASYAFDDSTGVLQVSGGSFTLGVWNGAFGNSIEKSSVKAVVFADAKVTGSTKLMFSGFDDLTTVEASGLDVSAVTDMSSMFEGCSKLVSLDVSGWDTTHVTDMSSMFNSCSSLKLVWVGENWSTREAAYNSQSMFAGCESLVGGVGTKWDAGYPADETYAHVDGGAGNPGYLTLASGRIGTSPYSFAGGVLCVGAGSFTIGDWNAVVDGRVQKLDIISVVIAAGASITGSAERMFENLNVSTSFDVSDLDVSGVTSMRYMFRNCPSLASLDLSGWDTGKVTAMSYMFDDCRSLVSLDGLSGWNVSSVKSFQSMFYGCKSLTSLDLSGWKTASVAYTSLMFYDCSSLKTVWVGTGWDMSYVEASAQVFGGCKSLVGGAGTKWDAGHIDGDYARVDGGEGTLGYLTLFSGYIGSSPYSFVDGVLRVHAGSFTKAQWDAEVNKIGKTGVASVAFAGAAVTGDARDMFSGFRGLTTVDASGLDVSQVTDMSAMFYGCSKLASLDASGWNTAGTTGMSAMFYGCSKLVSLDVSGWDTAGVTSMFSMFEGCSSLVSLDVSGWKTGSVAAMYAMFQGCSKLESLDVSGWDTSSAWNMSGMFNGCSSLASLDVSGWKTAGVTDMSAMFQDCSKLVSLDLSGWDTKNAEYMFDMFCGCSSLKTVWVGEDWSTGRATYPVSDFEDYMFYGCESLVGGADTKWDAAHIDKAYARVDGGADDPGYLTGKPVFKGYYLVLSGEIGVTFTLGVPSCCDVAGARVELRVGGKGAETVWLADLVPDEDGRYHVSCHVNSLEMAQDVVATLRWDGETTEPVTASCSVEDYARYVDAHEADYGEKAARLARAINDYGYYAQLWLSEQNGFTLGEGGDYAKMEEAYAKKYSYDEIKQSVDKYKIQKTLGNSGVKVSYQLHLDSATGISVRVRPEPKNTIKIDRSKLSGTLEGDGASGDAVVTGPQQSDGSYVVRLDGIPAHRLADWFRVSGKTNKDVFSAGVCALSYVRTVYWTSGYSNAAKDAMAAFLEYYEATMAYRGVTA